MRQHGNIPQHHRLNVWCYVLFLFLCLGGAGYTYAEDVSDIHIVTPVWLEQTNLDGTGIFFDILRQVYEPVGITLRYKFVPWKRAEMMIQTEQADARLAVVRTSDEQLMPQYPLYVDYTVAIFKKTAIREWKGGETLQGKRAVEMRGYNIHDLPYFEGITLQWFEVNTHEQAWKMLEHDRVDVYIDALIDVIPFIKANSVNMNPYQMETLYGKKAYIEFAHTAKSKKLIEIYDERIVELLRSGELARIFAKWDVKFEPFEIMDDEK